VTGCEEIFVNGLRWLFWLRGGWLVAMIRESGESSAIDPLIRVLLMTTTATAETFNGWANWATWNVALWLQNDEFIYRHAKANQNLGYKKWAARYRDETGEFATADGAEWLDPTVDLDALDDLLADL